MKNEKIYQNLVVLFKLFRNRPYHLAKYLLENSAISEEFLKKLNSSEKLKELSEENSTGQKLLPSPEPVYFLDIKQMDDFYQSFIDNLSELTKDKDIEQITKDLNEKLDNLIKSEKYEDAARVRDYMSRNNIKRI
jgi:hypothetical protein